MEMENESTYTPPEILDDMDEDVIHARMLANIPDNIDKTEGGFVYDFTMPTAIEKADIMVRLNEAIMLLFPEWSNGDWLEALGELDGIVRRSGTPAEASASACRILSVPGNGKSQNSGSSRYSDGERCTAKCESRRSRSHVTTGSPARRMEKKLWQKMP